MPADEPDLCPYPGEGLIACPECNSEIAGVVPGGTSDDPQPRCPACDAVIHGVVTDQK